MTLEDLRIFVAAAEAGSMSELARSLGRTQPAIAHHVRRLEQELGAPLLERTRRGVTLTEAGAALYDRTTAALAALRSARTEIETLRGASQGALAIAASSGTVRHILKPAILALRRSRPDVDFRLACSSTLAQQLDAVREGRADLAFVAFWRDTPGFQYRAKLDMPCVLLVHRDDPLAQRQRIHLDRIAETRFIAIGEQSTTSRFIGEHLAQRGGQLAIAHTVDTEGTAIVYVELGLGHAVLPAVQAQAVAKRSGLRALPIRGLPPMPLGWAARDFELLSAAGREFLSLFDRRTPRDPRTLAQ
jgi:DNA-binding transcriptional LysR family regulator